MNIYNTLTRRKEELVPLTPGEVRMYVCGVTVYDYCHVGHARSAVAFDVIRRHLIFRGYRVKFIKNFTDIDDKIIKKANEEGLSGDRIDEFTERFIKAYHEDMENLHVWPAYLKSPVCEDNEPRATLHIDEMKSLIRRLIASGFAYEVDGDVYFEVRKFSRYGQLSGKNLDELRSGARVEVDERKRDPLDFALWKSSKPGEPAWESPWGPGRPGWHIECSAMSMKYLGPSFDIHGGGEDLIFPHHENEIAQSEALTRQPFARVWIHNGFVNLAKEKMSKSLGNTLLIRDLVGRHHEDSLRAYLLGVHYRNPLDFWEARIHDVRRAISRVRRSIFDAFDHPDMADPAEEVITAAYVREVARLIDDPMLRRETEACCSKFEEAMDDDFNTPQALAVIYELHSSLNRYRELVEKGERQVAAHLRGVEVLLCLGRVLGLFHRHYRRDRPSVEATTRINQADELTAQRDEARKRRDWKLADELRKRLEELGAIVEDTPSGTRLIWKDE